MVPGRAVASSYLRPSMKVPPNRKGNIMFAVISDSLSSPLNESLSEKEGKSALAREGMLGESDPQ